MESKLRFALVGVACLFHFSCQHTSSTPDQPVDDKPTGGVVFRGNSASFNATRVFGPNVNVSRRSDQSWAGILFDGALDVDVRGDSILGSELKLKVEQSANTLVINGIWKERLMRFEVSPGQFLVRTPILSITLPGAGDGMYGAGGEIKLSGDAAIAKPPEPQFAIALLATFGRGSGH